MDARSRLSALLHRNVDREILRVETVARIYVSTSGLGSSLLPE